MKPARRRHPPKRPAARPVRRKPPRPALKLPALSGWLLAHLRGALFSLGKLWRNPLSSAMTIAVIGIALALPAGLYVMLHNLQGVAGGLDRGVQITVYLKKSIDDAQLQQLSDTLAHWPGVRRTEAITPAQGLAEFRRYSGFGNTLDALGSNPLPPVIVVYPDLSNAGAAPIEALDQRLKRLPQADEVRLDLAWAQRLYAIMHIANRATWIAGGMLALAVLLVVGNTIRLDILNRRQEIEVAKLIGATDAFIRRPFLYGGFWLGVFGGVLAVILVDIAVALLAGPVAHLARLYGSSFTLQGMDVSTGLRLIAFSALLGVLGAWLAVGRHLQEIEPR